LSLNVELPKTANNSANNVFENTDPSARRYPAGTVGPSKFSVLPIIGPGFEHLQLVPFHVIVAGSQRIPTRIVAVAAHFDEMVPDAGVTIAAFMSFDTFTMSHDHPLSPTPSVDGRFTVTFPLVVVTSTTLF